VAVAVTLGEPPQAASKLHTWASTKLQSARAFRIKQSHGGWVDVGTQAQAQAVVV
jgi:hypothetical protein